MGVVPFDGDMRPRALRPPEDEPALEGEGGVDCRACTLPDDEFLWTDERWRLSAFEPSGLPVVVILEPREHHAAPGDLPEDLARECGVMLGRVERAVRSSTASGASTSVGGAKGPSTCTGGSWGGPRA